MAEQKASDLQGRLEETKLELAETASILSTRDKELTDLKGTKKAHKQTNYNKGFRDAENSVGPVIIQAWKFRFMKGWMATVNAVDLLEESPFRSANQVLLPEDLVVKTQAEEQGEDSSKEEGTESLESRELSKQIDSHVVVLDDDNPRTTSTTLSSDTAQPIVISNPLPTNPLAGQEAPTSTPLITNTPSV